MRKKFIIILSLSCGIIFFFSSELLKAKEFNFPLNKEFTLKEPLILEMEDPRGEILIESHNQNKIIIQASKVVEAKDTMEAEELAKKIQIEIEKSDGLVRVKARYQKAEKESFLEKLFTIRKSVEGYVSYHILVPKEIQEADLSVTSGEIKAFYLDGELNLSSTSGDLEINVVEGKVSCSVTSGNIQAKDIKGELSLGGTSSDMRLKNIEGKLELKCTSGSVFIQDLKGSLNSSQTSGDLDVKGLNGNLIASNTSGDIWIEQNQGSLDLSTTSGDIEAKIQITPTKYYHLETISGDIELFISKNAQADLEIETTSGEISVNIPMLLKEVSRQAISGTLGKGGAKVEINTVSGDITLEEY